MAKKKPKKADYPKPSTAELVVNAMKQDDVEAELVRVSFCLEPGGLDRWISGRRKAPSPAFCDGFRDAFHIMPSIDKKMFWETWEKERVLPVINPYVPGLHDADNNDR